MNKPITVNDTETAESWLNKLAREAPEDRHFPEEYDYNDVHGLVIRVLENEEISADVAELELRSTLSQREAQVVALKKTGLTHKGIALTLAFWSLGPETISESAVDEYVRRARSKYDDAKETVALLQDVF